jgi:hypothetical protein
MADSTEAGNDAGNEVINDAMMAVQYCNLDCNFLFGFLLFPFNSKSIKLKTELTSAGFTRVSFLSLKKW